MREILFRGKRLDNGKWVEGYYMDNGYISQPFTELGGRFDNAIEVDPETVGQYTELKDSRGKKIFEGDIVKTWQGLIGQIKFGSYIDDESDGDGQGWFWRGLDKLHNTFTLSLSANWESHRVVGNIHDNPELMRCDK